MASFRTKALKNFALCLITSFFAGPFSLCYGQSLGQLFTSPEERTYLDNLRQDFLDRTASQGFDIRSEELDLLTNIEETQNVEFSLGGIVHNRYGAKSIWLNGAAISESDLPADVSIVKRQGQEVLRIATSQKIHYLKPGQTLNLESGDRWESYETKPAFEQQTTQQSVDENISPSTDLQAADGNTEANTEGTVAIKDLIEALQQIQGDKSESSSIQN